MSRVDSNASEYVSIRFCSARNSIQVRYEPLLWLAFGSFKVHKPLDSAS